MHTIAFRIGKKKNRLDKLNNNEVFNIEVSMLVQENNGYHFSLMQDVVPKGAALM